MLDTLCYLKGSMRNSQHVEEYESLAEVIAEVKSAVSSVLIPFVKTVSQCLP